MDIEIIQDNINELENADTTFDNVRELALLYVVRDNLKTSTQTVVTNEIDDILPAYQKYIDAKRKFQLQQTDETGMLKYIQLVCQETKEFILALYKGTDMRKERHYIVETLSYLYENICK